MTQRFLLRWALGASVSMAAGLSCGPKINPGGDGELTEEAAPSPAAGSNSAADDAGQASAGDGNGASGNTNAVSGNNNTVSGNGNAASSGNAVAANQTTLTYTGQTAAIINAQCVPCHGSGANPPDLSSFAKAKSGFTTGQGMAQIDQGLMPQAPYSLSSAQKATLKSWAAAGYPQ